MSKDFEHYAKQKGDEFKLQPRENVWERIEVALDEKNRRRVAWWWWGAPLLLLMGTGIGYIFFAGSNDKAIPAMAESVSQTDQPVATTAGEDNKTPGTTAEAASASVAGDEHTPANGASHTTNTNTPANKQIAKSSSSREATEATAPFSTYKGNHGVSTGDAIAGQTNTSAATRPLATESSEEHQTANTISKQAEAENVPNSPQPAMNNDASSTMVDSKQPEAIAEVAPGNMVETESPVVKAEAQMVDSAVSISGNKKSGVDPIKKNKTATWYVQAGAGKAGMHQTAFGTADKEYFADPSQINSGGTGTSSLIAGKPKNDEPGLSLSLAVQRRQDIGKRLQWLAGIGWQYQEVKQYLGGKVDSAISFSNSVGNFRNDYYYLSGSTQSEKGVNHRLFVTNDLSWQVLKNQSWLRLNVGLYTGFNIGNDYYVKDNAQRLVKNNAVYSRWFIGISPAVEMVIKKKWTIGLHTHIDFSKAYKELDNTPRHWSGWEIKAGIPLFNK